MRSPASAAGGGGTPLEARGVGGGAGAGAGVGREGRPLNRRMRLKASEVGGGGGPGSPSAVGVSLVSPTAAVQGAYPCVSGLRTTLPCHLQFFAPPPEAPVRWISPLMVPCHTPHIACAPQLHAHHQPLPQHASWTSLVSCCFKLLLNLPRDAIPTLPPPLLPHCGLSPELSAGDKPPGWIDGATAAAGEFPPLPRAWALFAYCVHGR